MNTRLSPTIGLLACLLALQSAFAQTERTGSDTTRVMQQLQQLTNERAALQTDNNKLKLEIESLKAQVGKLEGEQGALQRKAQTSEAAVAAATARANSATASSNEAHERTRAQLQEVVTRFRETAEILRDVETDRNTARGALSAREQELKTCVDRNVGLYELNAEILTRMEDRGFWSSVTESEPFTRIARTRLENLIDDYRYRVEEFRIERMKTAAQ